MPRWNPNLVTTGDVQDAIDIAQAAAAAAAAASGLATMAQTDADQALVDAAAAQATADAAQADATQALSDAAQAQADADAAAVAIAALDTDDVANASGVDGGAGTCSGALDFLATGLSNEAGARTAADALLAPLASPALTDNPTAPTQLPGTNNTRLATTAYADLAVAVEAVARSAATGLLVTKAGNGSDFADVAATRRTLSAEIEVVGFGVSGRWTIGSFRPHTAGAAATRSLGSGRVQYVPYAWSRAIAITGLAVEVTNTPAAATYGATFALYAAGSNGLPAALVADWTSLGTMNLLTGGAMFATMTFASTPVPAGQYWLALLALGTTITLNPSLSAHTGPHPACGGTAPSRTAGGFEQIGLAAFPNPAVPLDTTSQNGPMIYFQIA